MSKQTFQEFQNEIVSQIIEALEANDTVFWRRPWKLDPCCGPPTSLSSGKPYSGSNFLLLSLVSWKLGYESKFFGTYNQIRKHGNAAHVKRGEKGHKIVCYRPMKKKQLSAKGVEEEKLWLMQRTYTVFNAEQCIGLDQYRVGQHDTEVDLDQQFADAMKFIESIENVTIGHGGNRAFCRGSHVQMPPLSRFGNQSNYISTFLHEILHASEVGSKWDRQKFGYHRGELRAELGSVFMMQRFNLPIENELPQHVAYLRSWLPKAMKDNPKLIWEVAAQAQRGVDWLIEHSCLRTKPVEELQEVDLPF